MISIVKEGLDLGKLTLRELELMLKSELYINIDSKFAEELKAEIEERIPIKD